MFGLRFTLIFLFLCGSILAEISIGPGVNGGLVSSFLSYGSQIEFRFSNNVGIKPGVMINQFDFANESTPDTAFPIEIRLVMLDLVFKSSPKKPFTFYFGLGGNYSYPWRSKIYRPFYGGQIYFGFEFNKWRNSIFVETGSSWLSLVNRKKDQLFPINGVIGVFLNLGYRFRLLKIK